MLLKRSSKAISRISSKAISRISMPWALAEVPQVAQWVKRWVFIPPNAEFDYTTPRDHMRDLKHEMAMKTPEAKTPMKGMKASQSMKAMKAVKPKTAMKTMKTTEAKAKAMKAKGPLKTMTAMKAKGP